jgi:hypothetical protein
MNPILIQKIAAVLVADRLRSVPTGVARRWET